MEGERQKWGAEEKWQKSTDKRTFSFYNNVPSVKGPRDTRGRGLQSKC